jgi:glycine cleavage system aminomethyltransferase T
MCFLVFFCVHMMPYCRLCTANVDGDVEMMTYTQCLSPDGTMEADVTVAKGHDNQYLLIATDTAHRHVEAHLRRNLDPEGCKHVTITGNLSALL